MTMTSSASREQFDNENFYRCPMLGGPVPFKYCRTSNNGLPCAKMPVCWQGKIDVLLFLKDSYSEDELNAAFSPAKGRMDRIFDTLKNLSGEKEK